MKESLPPILSQSDYRAFLKEIYESRKALSGKYSYRKFSEDLGFEASNYLHLIVTGKRNLSLEGITKIQRALPWSAQEKNFFRALVQLNQADSKTERERFEREMEKILRKKRVKLSPDQFAYFSTWYIPVIREIVALKNSVSNLNWISRKLRPRVPEDQVKKALDILERLTMILKTSGRWQQNEQALTTDAEVTSDMVHNYHKEMLKLSLNALDQPADERDISAMTMSLSKRQFDWLKRKIVDFRDELQQELQEIHEDATQVAQLNIQLFKVTED